MSGKEETVAEGSNSGDSKEKIHRYPAPFYIKDGKIVRVVSLRFKGPFRIRRFVTLNMRLKKGALSPEEEQVLRDFGYIPVTGQRLTQCGDRPVSKGNPIIRVRVDMKTLQEIREFQRKLGNWNLSETVRYLILKGLVHERSGREVKLKLSDELLQRLEEHRELFNKAEGLNLGLGEFIQVILERAVGLRGE